MLLKKRKLIYWMIAMSLNFSFHNAPITISTDGICQIENEKYPVVGFGTYPSKGEVCSRAVENAYEMGYRIIDTATYYDNFDPIADVLKKHGREHFYLISKVWPTCHTRDLLIKDLEMTLKKLKTHYLDAYFLHWPNSQIPIKETLSTLEEMRNKGLIRHIGLSNVTINHLKRALELDIPITWIQVEMNPFYYDPELLLFCKNHGIGVQAWAPLGTGRIQADPLLAKLAQKYGKTPSQIAIRWIIQNGCLPLPGSQNPQHIKENSDILDFMITQDDMDEINERAKNGARVRVTPDMGADFTDEFDFSYEACWPISQ